MGHMKDLDRRIRQGGDDAIAAVSELMPRWISVEERLPEIDPLGVTATVICAHAEHDANRVPTGSVIASPASFFGSDQQGPFFKSMVNGRRLDSKAWMPLPEPPSTKGNNDD